MRQEKVQTKNKEYQKQEKTQKKEMMIMPVKGFPYQWPDGTKVPKNIRDKYKRCVKKVKMKGKVKSPHAVCRASIIGKKVKKRNKRK